LRSKSRELIEIDMGKARGRAVEDKQLINFHATQKTIEWKLFDKGLNSGGISSVHGDPAPTPVAANGVGFHNFLVQQPINEIAVAWNNGNKLLVKNIGQAEGNNESWYTNKRNATVAEGESRQK
jgi:hypothetical protein